MGAYDKSKGRHQAFYVPKKDVRYGPILIKAGEKVRVEESYKYSPLQRAALWAGAGLSESASFGTDVGDIPYCELKHIHSCCLCCGTEQESNRDLVIHLLTSSHAGSSGQ